ncbi:lysylphosphatidylglycerol synthase transmembrane domain-containing protein [Hymenobacter negativus]|uniref:Flippase-like domain-containing protein n=1 Tax=Hymenobacter negativus TaxID=2795026 RepID=A0ABS0Q8L4_9BACT|nr:lysylphosphatidylglycerol synthase transmembrane domain-containing protein [Hymenobacter negativus]MBH8559019.1 flippase-like domain-containing protein [Hymenobacter negativus]
MTLPPRLRAPLLLLLKLGLLAAALWFVFRRISPRQIGQVLASVQLGWLGLAVGLFAASKWLAARRLNYFQRAIGVDLSEAANLRLYWLGMFYNLFLPGGIGGDGYKVLVLRRAYPTKTAALVRALVLDRVSGLLALGVLLVALAWVVPLPLPGLWVWRGVAGLGAAGLLLGGAAVTERWFAPFGPTYWRTQGLALGVQAAQLLCTLALLAATHTVAQQPAYLLVFLASSVAAALPFTVGGAGAREVVFLLGAQWLGLDAAVSVSLSLLFYLLSAAVALPGALVGEGSWNAVERG